MYIQCLLQIISWFICCRYSVRYVLKMTTQTVEDWWWHWQVGKCTSSAENYTSSMWQNTYLIVTSISPLRLAIIDSHFYPYLLSPTNFYLQPFILVISISEYIYHLACNHRVGALISTVQEWTNQIYGLNYFQRNFQIKCVILKVMLWNKTFLYRSYRYIFIGPTLQS